MKAKFLTIFVLLILCGMASAATLCPETGELIPDHALTNPFYQFPPAPAPEADRDVDAWSGSGPWGGNVRSIITDPADPLHVFAACGLNLATLVGGVYASSDGGINWSPTTLQGKPYYALAASASEAGTFYAGARNGLYKSADNGVTWTPFGLSSVYILSLGVKPNNGNTIIVGKSGNVGIVVSTDGGNNFVQVGVNSGFMRQFAYSPANPERMFVVMGSQGNSVLTSVNNGQSWAPYGPAGDGWGMWTSPTDSLFSLVSHADGIYRTTDGGVNWSLRAGGTFRSVVEFNGTFFATSNSGGVLQSNDQGLTWTAYNTGVVQSTWQAGASSASGALLGHWGGIFRATGYQTPILTSHTGMNSAFVHGLGYYADTQELWAGAEGSGIYRSTDNGLTWEQRVTGLNNWMVYEMVPTNHNYYQSGRMLAGTLDGAYTSVDGGNTWTFVTYQGLQVSALEVHPTDPDKFWVGTSTGEIKYTSDGGSTWVTASGGMFGFAPRLRLGKGPLGQYRLFLSYQGSATAVWYSDDMGATFTASTGMEATTYQPMVSVRPILGTQNQIVYASSNTGIFKSTDNGATFSPSAMTSFSWSVITGPGSQVISGNDTGISFSADDCQTSSSLNQNLSSTAVWQLAWGTSTNQVFISTRGRGVLENRFNDLTYGSPQNLSAIAQDQQITLNWTQVNTQPSPLSYTVWRDGYPVASVDASLNTWINTGLVNGHSYKYFVSGVYEGDIHTSGIQIVSAVPAVQEFLPPTDLVGIVTEDDVNLSWNAPAAPFLTGFKVFRDGVLLNTINSPGLLTYTDLNVPNATYIYGVAATYQGGESGPTQIWVTVDYTSADDPSAPQLLTELFAASPNPARRSTELSFRLADAGIAELSIYNLKGQLVRKLLSGSITKGYHSVDWDGRDALGQAVAPGIYIFQLKTAGKVLRKKLTLTL